MATTPGHITAPTAGGAAPRTVIDNSRRKPGRRRSSTMSILNKDHGLGELEQRAPPPAAKHGQRGILASRKRLPWLDGPQPSTPGSLPGHFEDSRESLAISESAKAEVPDSRLASGSRSFQFASLGADPALRAIGSTPSLRDRVKGAEFKSMSVSSQSRPGVRPFMSKRDAKKALRRTNEPPRPPVQGSSEYSGRQSSDSREPLPPSLPVKTAASYERLVDRRSSKQMEPTPPVYLRNQWQESRIDLPLDSKTSPRRELRSSRQLGVTLKPSDQPAIPREWQDFRETPKVTSIPRHSTVVSPLEQVPQQPPPPPPRNITRKPTLFSMPTHLVASSGSSSISPRASSSIQPPQVSPPLPPPRRSSAQIDQRQSQSLARAVTGLEILMDEALTIARNAAMNGQNDDVAMVLDSATSALRKASTVHSQMNSGRVDQPLILSPIGSQRDSDSAASGPPGSEASSMQSRRPSIETMPTIYTKSAQSSRQPILVFDNKRGGKTPRSRKASVEHIPRRPSSEDSVTQTPPQLYQAPSAESVVRDFAYARAKTARAQAARALSKSAGWGSAADYYGDTGQSVQTQPGVRPSINPPMIRDDIPMPDLPGAVHKWREGSRPPLRRPATEFVPPSGRYQSVPVRRLSAAPTQSTIPPRRSSRANDSPGEREEAASHSRRDRHHHHPHLSHIFESPYYHSRHPRLTVPEKGFARGLSNVTDTRYEKQPDVSAIETVSEDPARYSGPPAPLHRNFSLKHPRRKHVSLREGQGFSLGRFHRRQPIAREWSTFRKRITAAVACANTVFIGLIAGIYAGEVPRMQYQLADTTHKVILGNVLLFACLGVTTLIFWPLPLLHGRKPYTLLSFAIILPLLFPQALSVTGYHSPNQHIYRVGLLMPRAFKGVALGFANINFLPTLFDLFGASLMPEKPHQEIVVYDDVRRQGGGMGVWLGIWSFCFVGSMSIGFCIGAVIISRLDPSWGFYIIVILLAVFLLVNVIAPETRRSPYRRSIAQFIDGEDNLKRRVARGEVKLHISNEGPKYWYQEVWAGLILTKRMVFQTGFFVLTLYLGWMYAQVTLVILLLGALLSRDYRWQPQYVGAASLAMAVGAFLALPLSKANLFSRARDRPQRTDSMTMRHGRVTWSSHMLRRCLFTLTLPLAAAAYALSSPGPSVNWTAPTIFCGCVGFLSNLAIAECVGLIMETFDTCDLQPGVNSKHRLQSLAETTRRRRTNYSSFPRVCAGFFAAQSLGFILSAAATGVSGDVTRAVGAQTAIAIVAAILLFLTILFIGVLWRWREVQVIPSNPYGVESKGGIVWGPAGNDPEWKPVIIGNPSGKMRRMNLLELGNLSRWAEIRRLNKLAHG